MYMARFILLCLSSNRWICILRRFVYIEHRPSEHFLLVIFFWAAVLQWFVCVVIFWSIHPKIKRAALTICESGSFLLFPPKTKQPRYMRGWVCMANPVDCVTRDERTLSNANVGCSLHPFCTLCIYIFNLYNILFGRNYATIRASYQKERFLIAQHLYRSYNIFITLL